MKKNKIVAFCSFVSELSEHVADTVMTVFPKPRINLELISCEPPGARLAIVPVVSFPMNAPPVSVMLQEILDVGKVPTFLIAVLTLNNPPVIA